MQILVAPNAFKNSLTAPDAAEAIRAEPATVAAGNGNCLTKPVNVADLRGQLEDGLAGKSVAGSVAGAAPEAIARARASFGLWGSLLEAARELARGMPAGPANGW